tara:strand:+ start:25134 stop:26177 length:1044 start_codon:yes stop_codon:yes gene_type:complete
LTGFERLYDIKMMGWVNDIEYEDVPVSEAFRAIHLRSQNDHRANEIVPIVKLKEHCYDRLVSMTLARDSMKVTRPFVKYNGLLLEMAKLEGTGIGISDGYFDKVFSGDTAHSNYNFYTSTGRPSNTFGGINFGALNKSDGVRKGIVPKNGGMLVEFDYDAYHLRLLANLVGWDFPLDRDVHQYFADEVYKCSYEEAKTKSFQILYGQVPSSEDNTSFFWAVNELSKTLEHYFKANKCFNSHIYKKPFYLAGQSDVNRNKLLNYYIQSFETERNVDVIKSIHKYLRSKETSMILYTYDSFLFDFKVSEGLQTLSSIKELLEKDGFPVKAKAGSNYHELQDITEKLRGS